MAPQHISTAIKEEWSLTDEQVALIEASTAHSAQPGLVGSAASAIGLHGGNDVAIVLVPTPDRLDTASTIVALWGIKEPSEGDIHGSTKHHLRGKTLVETVIHVVRELKQKKGFAATALRIQDKAKAFILHCLHNAHDDNYAIWDATSITNQTLSIGQDGASTYEPEELSSKEDNYCQAQVALVYRAHLKSFTFGHAYVYRTGDELTTAIVDSGTTDRINAIRILYANLLAQVFKNKGDNRFKLVDSNQPYPDLNDNE
jgi:hypothetical protein